MTAPLCKKCSSISFDALQGPPGFDHSSFVDLEYETAKYSGCPLCCLLWRALAKAHAEPSKDPRREKVPILIDDAVRLSLIFRPKPAGSELELGGWPGLLQGIRVLCGRREVLDQLRWGKDEVSDGAENDGPRTLMSVECELGLFGHRGDPSADLFVFRDTTPGSESAEAFELIKSWIRTCESSHTFCRVPNNWPRLPSRVIDVGPADGSKDPYLLEVTDPCQASEEYEREAQLAEVRQPCSQKYIALSYCRGKQSILETSEANLNTMRKGIPMSSIPRTIRDAIVIARNLGVQYLWVDAFCILQGSDDNSRKDWETECQKMADIYSRAYLTITAALCQDADSGIFKKSTDPAVPNVTMPYKSSYTPNIVGYVSLGLARPKQNVDPEPLSSRGWAFQEDLLSSRVLIYTKNQVAWECPSTALSEGGHWERRRANSYPHFIAVPSWMTVPAYITAPNWVRIVQDYTACNVTFEDDKLPALSGIASLLKSDYYGLQDDQYLAGLWKGSLLYELLWVHQNLAGGHTTRRSRPRAFRAPSWSWASLDGNVAYPELTQFPHGMEEVDDCKLTAHEINVKGSNPFGQVAGGWIKLKGRMGRVRVLRAFLVNWSSYTIVGTYSLDMGGSEAFDSRDVWCFLVRGTMGLILTHRRGVGPNYDPYCNDPEFGHLLPDPDPHYRRIGVFFLIRRGAIQGFDRRFDRWKKEAVTIF